MRAWHQSSVSPVPSIVSQCRRWKPGAAISAGMSRGCMTLAMAQCRTLPTTSYLGHSSITMASRATAEALLLIRFLDLDPATPSSIPHARCITDLETTETPLVSLFRSYYSAPEQQRSCLSRFRSASPSSPRPGDTCHEVFDMKNSTSSFAHDGWGITSSPLSCTCFGDCAGQDQSHTGYKLCRAPDIYCPPESVSFCPTLNFTLIPFHMRESWQEQDPRQPEGEETRFKGRRFPAEGLSMVHVHTCPFSHILVLPLPSRWGF